MIYRPYVLCRIDDEEVMNYFEDFSNEPEAIIEMRNHVQEALLKMQFAKFEVFLDAGICSRDELEPEKVGLIDKLKKILIE